MLLVDVNVLLHAFRSDAPDHARYRSWLTALISGPSRYGVSPQVLGSLVRISTHPGIYKNPSCLSDALAFSETVLRQPNANVVEPGPRHWVIFTGLCSSVQASGNRVQDAWLAALALENGCEWITLDRDFKRFPGLRFRPPW